jgi:protein-glutamine gamma-glutamyltransferase
MKAEAYTGTPHEQRGYLIPRNTLLLLMAAQFAVLLPHVMHQSAWIWLVCGFCFGWRWMVFRGRWRFPGRWVKVLLVIAAATGVTVDASAAFSLETATALLILAFALKLLEMRSRRDAYLVIFLSYFVVATGFLFDQSITGAAYQALALVIVTGAMAGLNQFQGQPDIAGAVRLSGALLLQALPLMLVVFLFFPRVAPLWSVPMPGGSETGISDEVRPGDVARLARSDRLAFRVVFDGQAPAADDLYWRGLVYSHYIDGTWRQARISASADALDDSVSLSVSPFDAGGATRYLVLMEPTHSNWLFGLDTPTPLSPGISVTRDFRMVADEPVKRLFRYRAESVTGLRLDQDLPDWMRRRETGLPLDTNPRTRAFARGLFAEAGSATDYVDAVLEYIRREPFHYTLEPPQLTGPNEIDAFWFDSRRGFCAHYASAFVVLMRSAGIPARMVGGYQGGEFNPRSGHLVVRQYDAHAWAEVWLAGLGWQRVDPTAMVAPDRIARGLDAALSESDRAGLSLLTNARLGRYPLLADMLGLFESLEHRWNMRVVGYDPQLQARLLGELTPARIAKGILIGAAGSLALVLCSLLMRRPLRGHPTIAMLKRFSRGLRRLGLERAPGETPQAYFTRLNAAAALDGESERLLADVQCMIYNPELRGASEHRFLRWAMLRLRLRLMLKS